MVRRRMRAEAWTWDMKDRKSKDTDRTCANNLDPRLQAGVRKLHDTLASLTGLAVATASELFERHDTPLARAMTL